MVLTLYIWVYWDPLPTLRPKITTTICWTDETICKMLVLSIFSILILFSELTTTNANNAQEAPLKFIWQVATQGKCQKKGIHINVTQYGILENSNPGSDGFEGNVITELYYTVGKWPFIERDDRPGKTPREWINGGLPQVPQSKSRIMYALEWRTVYAPLKRLFWCLLAKEITPKYYSCERISCSSQEYIHYFISYTT